MKLQTLQSLVINGLSQANYSLAATTLDSAPITNLFSTVFRAPVLALAKADATQNTEGAVVTGTLIGAPHFEWGFLADMALVATFTLDGSSNPQVHLTFTSSSWNMLATMSSWGSGLCGEFAWAGSRIDFDSAQPKLLPSTFPAQYNLPEQAGERFADGLALTQTLTCTAVGAALKWLLGSDSVTVTGPTRWSGGLPEMDLAATLRPLTVDEFELVLGLHAVAVLDASASTPYLVLSGTLSHNGGSIQVPVNTVLGHDPLDLLTVVANYGGAGSFALAEIATFLGTSLDGQIPPSFPALRDLTLSPVVLTIDPSAPSVNTITATVGLAHEPWPADNKIVQFSGFLITFDAVFNPKPTQVTTTVAATAHVGTGVLDARIHLPALDFHCALAKGSNIDVTALMQQIAGASFGSLPLKCNALIVTGNLREGTYTFAGSLASGWSFCVDSTPTHSITFDAVTFLVNHLAAAGSLATPKVELTAQFNIAGTVLDLSADHQLDDSWVFEGKTQGLQTVQLSSLLSDILTKFRSAFQPPTLAFTLAELDLTVRTASPLSFRFQSKSTLTLAGKPVKLDISVGRIRDKTNVLSSVFEGTLCVGSAVFTVDFTDAANGETLRFHWSEVASSSLTLQDVATFFDLGTLSLPEDLDPALTAASFVYDSKAETVAFSMQSSHGSAGFVTFLNGVTRSRVGVLLLDVDLDVSLTSLPVVGQDIPASLSPGMKDLQIIWSNQTLDSAAQATFDAAWKQVNGAALPAGSLSAGITLAADLCLGSHAYSLVLPLHRPAATTQDLSLADTLGVSSASLEGEAKWFNIGKSLGPVSLARVGLAYTDSTLFVLLDASLTLSILSLDLEGLGFGSPLTHFAPHFSLDGISLALKTGPVSISGGLLRVPDPPVGVTDDWVGDVTIALSPYLISGSAGFAKVYGHASFFVFAQVQGDFGGPPAFFVTGFMGGFGYNSALRLPTVDHVADFPFLNAGSFGASPSPADVLKALSDPIGEPAWVTPTVGEDWGAAGILFRSFELVLGKLLLVAGFGKDFEIALLGLASMSLPQGETATSYAFIELQIEAVLKPSQGTFSLAASLTSNSFLFTQDCHLTGGFAFCLWFGSPSIDPHTGDFVITVGGYHPAFLVPAWYPRVARVGFDWPIDSHLSVQGGAYFALTPSAAMAGGSLHALFRSGSLRASFSAYTDLLITWKPFTFTATIGISVSASYTLHLLFTSVTLSIEVGANLLLWGPPTGGRAHIEWTVLAFTIPFGADPGHQSPTLDWNGFQSLLPNGHQPSSGLEPYAAASGNATVLKLNVLDGLHRTATDGAWLVRLAHFTFTALTAVPATSLLASGTTVATAVDSLDIRPMGLSGVSSVFAVTVTGHAGSYDITQWSPVPQQSRLPEALYGKPLAEGSTPKPRATLISGLRTGLQFTAPAPTPGVAFGPFSLTNISDPGPKGSFPLSAQDTDPLPTPQPQANAIQQIAGTLGQGNALLAQQALVAALTACGVAPPTTSPLSRLGASAGTLLVQNPMLLPPF